MNRKQFLFLLIALIVLAAAGAAVFYSNQSAWKRADTRVGNKVLPELKAAEVTEIVLTGPASLVHVVKSDANWIVKERQDFPADREIVTGFLQKLADLKVIQTEPAGEDQRRRLQLVAPKSAAGQPEAQPAKGGAQGANGTVGTVLELKNGAGKSVGKLILGKTLMRPSDHAGDSDIPSGRYLLAGDGEGSIVVVADPIKDADPSPAAWLDKDVMRADSVKTVTVTDSQGRQRWSLSRSKEGDLMSFVGGGDKPDPQKGQDTISVFYGITLVDVIPKDKQDTGLDKPLVATAQSFDGVTYALRVGNRADDNRYFVSVSSSGDPVKSPRVPGKDESAEEKVKKDKEYEELWQKRVERRARDKTMEKWSYIVPATSIAAILKDRQQLMPEKKAESVKK